VDVYDNFRIVPFFSTGERVFDRNIDKEIFLLVFIFVSLQPRNPTPNRIDESFFEV
jgi:hypothetical protein